jgi:hypothetical protein
LRFLPDFGGSRRIKSFLEGLGKLFCKKDFPILAFLKRRV